MTHRVAEMDRRSFRTSCRARERQKFGWRGVVGCRSWPLFVVHDLLSNSAGARCPEGA
jgi:hypothetical protein